MIRNSRPLWTNTTKLSSVASSAKSRVPYRTASSVTIHLPKSRVHQPLGLSRRCLGALSTPLMQRTTYSTKDSGHPQAGRDPEEETKFGQERLKKDPEHVTTTSTTRPTFDMSTSASSPGSPSPTSDLKHDLHAVKDTFALSTVPKETYALGLFGTIPYLATSLGTVYLSWDLNTAYPPALDSFRNYIMISHESAHDFLALIEPIQLGYGAIIISFLGAIHWGLELGEKPVAGRSHTNVSRLRFRYGMGVLSSVVAWPTLLMPWHYALTAQFAAFTGLYFADVRASARGWAPAWYASYRFVLTAIVGVSIMLSLIGRSKVGDTAPRLTGLSDKIHQTHGEEPYDKKWEKREKEDMERARKEKEEEEKRKKEEEKKQKKERKTKDKREDKGGNEEEKDKEEKGKDDKGEEDNDKDGEKERKK